MVFCYHVTTWFGAVLSQYVKRAWINEENALVCISVIKRSKLDDVKQVLAKGNTEHLKFIVTFKMNKLWIETNICTVRKQLTLTSSSGGTERLRVRSWLVVSGSFGCSADHYHAIWCLWPKLICWRYDKSRPEIRLQRKCPGLRWDERAIHQN